MGYKCQACKEAYTPGPDGSLVHSCKKNDMNYRVNQEGGEVPGHNHPGSFLVRDKNTGATKPDTAAQKRPKKKKKY